MSKNIYMFSFILLMSSNQSFAMSLGDSGWFFNTSTNFTNQYTAPPAGAYTDVSYKYFLVDGEVYDGDTGVNLTAGFAPSITAFDTFDRVNNPEFLTLVTSSNEAWFLNTSTNFTNQYTALPAGDYMDVAYNLFAIDGDIYNGDTGALLTAGFSPFINTFDTFDRINNVNQLTLAASTVPVPAAAWLFGSGLLGLIGIARRKKA